MADQINLDVDFRPRTRTTGFKKKLRAEVFKKADGLCFYCGVILFNGEDGNRNPAKYTIDHIVPYSKGGTADISNLVPCCRRCNSKKGNKKWLG